MKSNLKNACRPAGYKASHRFGGHFLNRIKGNKLLTWKRSGSVSVSMDDKLVEVNININILFSPTLSSKRTVVSEKAFFEWTELTSKELSSEPVIRVEEAEERERERGEESKWWSGERWSTSCLKTAPFTVKPRHWLDDDSQHVEVYEVSHFRELEAIL